MLKGIFVFGILSSLSMMLDAKECTDKFISQLVNIPNDRSDASVVIDCDLNLEKHHVVKKRLLFDGKQSSGVTVNCHGATLDGSLRQYGWKDIIEVRSKKIDDQLWHKVENVTIKNCHVLGSIRVWGMGKNGEEKDLKASSRLSNHTQTVRANAPTNIVFDHINLVANGRNPLYFSPGVSQSVFKNSQITGYSTKVAIYLDAESTANKIVNNKFSIRTGSYWYGRGTEPIIAIDGSSHNLIKGNSFLQLSHGGIYLYRNCGLQGVVRHARPSHNVISNNLFYYDEYNGLNPAIHIGAHGGGFFRTMPYFGSCSEEDDVPFGSGISNLDYSQYNHVTNNTIVKRSVKDVIKIGVSRNDISSNSHNIIEDNRTVGQ